MAGFGGQGILTCGQILAVAAMNEGKRVTWVPSYGPEQRGGTANCVVTISDRAIGSPLMEEPGAALIFNQPSLDKYGRVVKSGGLLVINSDLVQLNGSLDVMNIYRVPAEKAAEELGSTRVVNSIMLGCYVAVSGVVSLSSVEDACREYFKAKPEIVEINLRALQEGSRLAAAR